MDTATEQPYRFLLENKTVWAFLLFQGAVLGAFFALWYLTFPDALIAQWRYGLWKLGAAFVIAHFVWAMFEMLFHRYVLHVAAIPGLGIFAKKHRAHHNLTPVEHDGVGVVNRYPILEEAQRAHSVFPWYAMPIFFVVATPMSFFLQWIIPTLPMLIGVYTAIWFSYILYEIIHAYEHRSYELWWKPRIQRAKSGHLWRTVYAFHLAHHAAPRVNEAVGGFFGLPVADWIMGTYFKPQSLFQKGEPVVSADFKPPQGYWLIRTLDRILLASVSPNK